MNFREIIKIFNSQIGQHIYLFAKGCINSPIQGLEQINQMISNMCLDFGIPENHVRLMIMKYQNQDLQIIVMVFNLSQNKWISEPIDIRDIISEQSQITAKFLKLKEAILYLYQSTTFKILSNGDTNQ